MNDRHNRIAGCQAAVDAAREQFNIAAHQLASAFIRWQEGDESPENTIADASRAYRKAGELCASALYDLADALRR